MKRIYLILVYHMVCYGCASGNTNLRIENLSGLNSNFFTFFFHDGMGETEIKAKFINNSFTYTSPLKAEYGSLIIEYFDTITNNFASEIFFVKSDSGVIVFKTSGNDPKTIMKSATRFNVHTIDEMGGKLLKDYIEPAQSSFNNFMKENKEKLPSSDSLINLSFKKADSVTIRKLQFVLDHPNLYISFWIFYRELIYTNIIKADSLMLIYNTIFPEQFKGYPVGEDIVGKINLKLTKLLNVSFLPFSATDLSGKLISDKYFLNKYTLVTFWASWCVPCHRELPKLKAIKKRFDNKLQLLSISIDSDQKKFLKAVENNKSEWPQVLATSTVINTYGIRAIPLYLLIDQAGHVINSYQTIGNTDSLANKLDGIFQK